MSYVMMKKGWKVPLTIFVLIFLLGTLLPMQNVSAKSVITLSKTSVTVYVGGDYAQLKVAGTSDKVSWKSENAAIAKVSGTGKVYGVKQGKTEITATVNGKKLKCKVTVKNRLSASTYNIELYSEKCIYIKIKNPKATDVVTFAAGNEKISCYWEPLHDTNYDDIISAKDNLPLEDYETIPLYISLNLDGRSYIDVYLNGSEQSIRIKVNVIPAPDEKANKEPDKEVKNVYTNEEKIAAYGVRMLYELLRNPESLVIDEISYITNQYGNSIVLINYSAENGYGGVNRKNISLGIEPELDNVLSYFLDTKLGYIDVSRNSSPRKDSSRVAIDISRVNDCIQNECYEQFQYYKPTFQESNFFHEKDAMSNEMIDN